MANPTSENAEPISFLSFRLDRRAGSLTRAGETIALRPKTWAVLLYLVERPGVLVSVAELLDAVWPDVAVTPSTLTKSIVELRVALNDDARQPRVIETVHARGFRFIATGGHSAPGGTIEEGRSKTSMFVGRDAELGRLRELFDRACAGEMQLAFISGAAGVGKTALVEEFLDSEVLSASPLPVRIARGTCVAQHGEREAYMPVLDAIAGLAQRPGAERLIWLLRRVAPTWLVQMPWLLGDDADALRRSLSLARPERMLREFAMLAESLTDEVALVLAIEDLHWSDPSTVDLLSYLGRRRGRARFLVICTYRPTEMARNDKALSSALQALNLYGRCTELALRDLSEEELRRYLELRFPGADFIAALTSRIHRYTNGNPLLAISVVEHELLHGRILETSPGWALAIPLEKLQLEVPEDARRVLEIGFEHLSPGDRSLLRVASIAGIEFSAQILAAALECRVEDVESRCEDLARHQWFLRRGGTAEWPDGSAIQCYAFAHELQRSVAYSEIPGGRRQSLHLRVGLALEAAYGDRAGEIAPELALHFERGGDYPRAIRYLDASAALARQRFAVREAATCLQTAIALMARLPDDDARQSEEVMLRLALGPVLNELHGFASEPVGENYERAYELCARSPNGEQLFQVLYGLAHYYAGRADGSSTDRVLRELDEVARRLGTAEHRVLVDSALVRAANVSGRFAEACHLAEERLSTARWQPASDSLPILGADPLVLANCHHAFALWMLGDCERARALMRTVREAAEADGAPFPLVTVLWFDGALEVFARRPSAARVVIERALDLSVENGFSYWNAMAHYLHGWVRIEEGRPDEGIDELERARASLSEMGARLFSTHIFCLLAEGHLRAGAIAAGLAAVEEGLAVADSTSDHVFWPELWRLEGELLLAAVPAKRQRDPAATQADSLSNRRQTAEDCLLRGLDLARQSGAKAFELRVATSLARLWSAGKRSSDASALLGEICRSFGRAETVDLAEARALLDQLHESGRSLPRQR